MSTQLCPISRLRNLMGPGHGCPETVLRGLIAVLAACGGSSAGPADSGTPDAGIDASAPPDAVVADAAPPPRYQIVWIRNAPDQPFGSPYGINQDGDVAGYSGPGAWDPFSRAIRVTAAGTVDVLPDPIDEISFAFSVTDDGRLTGEIGRRPVLWEGDQARMLAVPDGYFSGAAHAVHSSGWIAGSYADSDDAVPIGPRHCTWDGVTAAAPVLLPGLTEGNHLGKAWAVNAAGQIAGVSGGSEGVFYAVRWDSRTATPVQIGPLEGAFNSEGRGINLHGDVVGRSSGDSFTQAFVHLRAEDELVPLGYLDSGNAYSEAFGINADRHVVGVSRAGDYIIHATLWIDGVAHDLNDLLVDSTGISALTSAAAINDAGDIAAEADLPTGDHAIVLLRRAPPPG